MAELSNPHDAFFKDTLSRDDVARDFLQHYLPAQISQVLDLSTLSISKDSFVDRRLGRHYSDLLYTVALRNGREVHLYVLFEHKSLPEPEVALDLLRYMLRIWELDQKQRRNLLPILPVVVYHGRVEWRVGLQLHDLLKPPDELRSFVPDFRFWLCDLSKYEDAELKGAVILRAGLQLLKYILRPELSERLPVIFSLLAELADRRTGL